MASHYSIIQYCPDAATHEAINIALVTWDANNPDTLHVTATEDWNRVEVFARAKVSDRLPSQLRDFLLGRSGDSFDARPGPYSTLSWTKPAGSLLSASELLAQLKNRIL